MSRDPRAFQTRAKNVSRLASACGTHILPFLLLTTLAWGQNPADSIEVLIRGFRSQDSRTRDASFYRLKELREHAVPGLIYALADTNQMFLAQVINTLDAMGPAAISAAPA